MTALTHEQFRSVHNTRIERLWRDMTATVGKHWKLKFELLRSEHGLDVDNPNHLWLLHHVFLDALNDDLMEFAERWNTHIMRFADSGNRSPKDIFYFDMFARGFRGDPLPPNGMPIPPPGRDDPHPLPDDEVAWLGLEGDVEADENEFRPWMGNTRPPTNIRSVIVDPPTAPLGGDDASALLEVVGALYRERGEENIITAWRKGLAFASLRAGNLF